MHPSVEKVKVGFQIPVGPGMTVDRWVNCFIIYDKDICLVDSGTKGAHETVFNRIIARGRDPEEIATLVHTHAHPDHIGSSAEIAMRTGCEVLIHEAEVKWLEDPSEQRSQRPVPGFDDLVGGGVKVDRALIDGDELRPTGSRMKVLHVPGHSPGSICLLHKGMDAIFTGDAVPVPGDLPVYDDVGASIRSLQGILSAEWHGNMYPSWDEPSAGDKAREKVEMGMSVIENVHRLVSRTLSEEPSIGSEELCRICVQRLGLPAKMANPLLARTFNSHRKEIENANRPKNP
jgi:hydroxyacylglutathione hydrolase